MEDYENEVQIHTSLVPGLLAAAKTEFCWRQFDGTMW
jgi:hypothetical protein